MVDEATAAASEPSQVTFSIKSSSDAKFNVTVPTSTTIADLKRKLSSEEYANISAERMRLIYSGRVLKDHDTVGSVKIKDSHTVHLVKSAESNARQNPASQGGVAATGTSAGSQPSAAAQIPSNFATGVGNDPLAALTGARYAGFHGLPGADTFGPDGGLGGQDPDQLLRMMDNPNFMQQMNEAMDNPAFMQMIQNSPMLRDNPMAQQIFRDPEMRRQIMNPAAIRAQLQMQRAMGNMGMGGMGGGGGAFPAPGVTDTTPGQNNQTAQGGNPPADGTNTAGSPPPNPFADPFGGAGGNAANPFAALFGPGGAGANPFGAPPAQGGEGQQGQNQTGAGGLPPNFFEQMQMLQQMMGGAGGGGGMFGGASAQQAPPDNRPPEERYADQLRQLNDMGFYDFDRNVTALRRSGGSVPGAVDYLLNG